MYTYLDEIQRVMEDCSNEVVAIIANRLKTLGGLTETDALKLANLSRTSDLKAIERAIAKSAKLTIKKVDDAIDQEAKHNDFLADKYYKIAGKVQNSLENDVLNAIKANASKSMADGILNLSHTTAFAVNGGLTIPRMAYINAINRGIYATQQGLTDYQSTIRNIVKQLTNSGLRVAFDENGKIIKGNRVVYNSGYTRRLDSAIRLNVLEGVRRMNQEYRTQQGREFGADGVEISVHDLCSPDHQGIQGRQFSNEQFERLQESLNRPIGHLNCQHTIFPIILGVSEPAYSQEEIEASKQRSNQLVTFTSKRGTQKTMSLYEASQEQRKQETIVRHLKDRRDAYKIANQTTEAKDTNRAIRQQVNWYKQMSRQIGLSPKMKRLSVPRISTPSNPAKAKNCDKGHYC